MPPKIISPISKNQANEFQSLLNPSLEIHLALTSCDSLKSKRQVVYMVNFLVLVWLASTFCYLFLIALEIWLSWQQLLVGFLQLISPGEKPQASFPKKLWWVLRKVLWWVAFQVLWVFSNAVECHSMHSRSVWCWRCRPFKWYRQCKHCWRFHPRHYSCARLWLNLLLRLLRPFPAWQLKLIRAFPISRRLTRYERDAAYFIKRSR